ncbi:MAG: hypothetical protein M5U34_11540 [Chloroflexi bacterium]|nr:hypothetical protein [Chloroflexota bacterium]
MFFAKFLTSGPSFCSVWRVGAGSFSGRRQLAARLKLSFVPPHARPEPHIRLFLAMALWAAHKLHDLNGLRPPDILFDLGQIQATDKIAYVDLGLRLTPLHLRRRLTTGKIIVVDVYNPQWTPGRSLARARAAAPHRQLIRAWYGKTAVSISCPCLIKVCRTSCWINSSPNFGSGETVYICCKKPTAS